jgi:hypothetical protein
MLVVDGTMSRQAAANSFLVVSSSRIRAMQLDAIACNQCGAPLQIPDALEFVTCNHCGASLAVRREESVTYTEVLSQLAEQTAGLAEQVAHLRYQNAVADVDRRWDKQRETLLGRNKDGSTYEPNATVSIIGGGVLIVIGIFLAAATGAGGIGMSLIGTGLLFAVLGGYAGARFDQAKTAYRRRRARLKVDQFHKLPDDEITADEIPELK